MEPNPSCPDPELLAAFLDGGLEPAEREAVVAHLADCDECREAVAEVIHIQEAVPAVRPEPVAVDRAAAHNPSPPLGSFATGVLALAVAVLAGAAWFAWKSGPAGDASELLERLAEAAGHRERIVEARLSGPFAYAPMRAPVRAAGDGGEPPRPWPLVAAAGEIRDAHAADLSAGSQHAAGVAALLMGDYPEAVRALAAAAEARPDDAAIQADLAAAYYERARLGGRPDDLPRALSAAERAVAADPSRPEGWFNRALALSMMAPRDVAREAWEAYLAHEASSPWRQEAEARLEALRPAGEPWPELLARLRAAPDRAAADAAVRHHTSRARDHFEREVLPAWADAALAGRDARAPLATARLLADSFARLSGDPLARDTVAAIERAEAAGPAARRQMADALAAFGAAKRVADITSGEAAAAWSRAEALLRQAASPLHLRAAIEIAANDYYGGRYAQALARLDPIRAEAERHRYGDVVARTTWIAGLVAFSEGRLGDARYLYERTLEAAVALGDSEQAAWASVLLANLFYYVGDHRSAWNHWVLAASVSPGSEPVRVKHGLLVGAAASASAIGEPEAAFAIQTAALQTASVMGRPTHAELLTQRAGTLYLLGRHDDAAVSLARARTLLQDSSHSPLAQRVAVIALMREAELFAAVDPPRAIGAAGQALAALRQRGDRLRVAEAALTLARARAHHGDVHSAARDLAIGIEAFDEERRSLSDEGRIAYSERAWGLFEQGVRLALARGDLDAAFAYSERGRARTIVEARQWGSAAVPSLAEIRAALPRRAAVLVLNQLDEALVSWLIAGPGVTTASVPLTRRRTETLAAAYAAALGTGTGGIHPAGELYDAIVRPHLGALQGVRLLCIVPDTPFGGLAFAGLLDRRRGRFLIEDVALTVAPSATVFARAMARAAGAARPGSLLVLGDPAAPASGASPAPLPASRGEAAAIAALYDAAELRVGPSATPDRLLEEAPGRDVVHVAAHAVTNPEYPLLSRLLLADLPGRPYSGAVFARDVAARDFSGTRLVVLAACDSGGGPEARGEGALSLARAFLAAGVPTVVSALGPLNDHLARQVFVEFHRGYRRGASAAESLQQVQVQALQQAGRQPGPWARLAVFGASTPPSDRTEGATTVNRRRFLHTVSAGAAVALAQAAGPRAATGASTAQGGSLTVRFVGMMGFITRSDGSILAATPGHHTLHLYPHVPFAMAPAGSRLASALGMAPAPGVIPGAYDDTLADASPDDFAFLCLEHSSMEVAAGDGRVAVDHRADQLAQMRRIFPGKRLRGDVARWSPATATLRGGRLVNSSAHPDAGKVWRFGSHAQRLTDAVHFEAGAGRVRLALGRDVREWAPAPGEHEILWFFSAAGPQIGAGNPRRLEHGVLLAQFLAGADEIVAECDEATGREVPATGAPCEPPAVASAAAREIRAYPPSTQLCYGGDF